jgi:hypothetical protein
MNYKLILKMTATNFGSRAIQATLYDTEMLIDGLDSTGDPDKCLTLALDIVDRLVVAPHSKIEVLFDLRDNRSQNVSFVDRICGTPQLPSEAEKESMVKEIKSRFDHMRSIGIPLMRSTPAYIEECLPI